MSIKQIKAAGYGNEGNLEVLDDKQVNIDSEVSQNFESISGFVDVKRFGVIGDGVADDTEAFRRAFQSAEKLVFYGKSKITGTLNTGICHHLIGQGEFVTTVNGVVFEINTDGFVMENLKMTSTIKDMSVGIDTNGKGKLRFTNLTVANYGCGLRGGRRISPYEQGVISQSTIVGCDKGFEFIERSEYFIIANCIINSNGIGVKIIGGNIAINNCTVTNNYVKAIEVLNGENGGHGVISGCQINHNERMDFTDTPNGFTVTGNNIFATPIYVTGNKAMGGDIVFSGNTLSGLINFSEASVILNSNSYGALINFVSDINSDIVGIGNKTGYHATLPQTRVQNFVDGKAIRLKNKDTGNFTHDILVVDEERVVTKWGEPVWVLNAGCRMSGSEVTETNVNWYNPNTAMVGLTNTVRSFVDVEVILSYMVETSKLKDKVPTLAIKCGDETVTLPTVKSMTPTHTLYMVDYTFSLLAQPPLVEDKGISNMIRLVCNEDFEVLKDSITVVESGCTGYREAKITIKNL